MSIPVYDRDTLIQCLKKASTALGKSPRPHEYTTYWLARKYRRKKAPRHCTVRDYFGGWDKALEAAELAPLPSICDQSIIRCLLIATMQVGYVPNTAEYDEVYHRGLPGLWISRQTIIGHCYTWRSALSLAGLEAGSNCRKSRHATVRPQQSGLKKQRTKSARPAPNPTPPLLDEQFIELILLLTEAGDTFTAAEGKRSQRAKMQFANGMEILGRAKKLIASRATR